MHWIFGKSNFIGLNHIYREKPLKLIFINSFWIQEILLAAFPRGVSQGSILGSLLFLLYVYDVPRAVKCDFFLYADDACLTFQHENVKEIENQLSLNFSSLCDWFIDNK